MLHIVLIGLAAGAASGLLFASIASGSLLAFPLFYLSPLPILIGGLAWSWIAGLVAALAAALALAGLFGSYYFFGFLIGVGLPAWWLSYLALLARESGQGTLEWYPVGRLVLWAAALACGVVAFMLFTIATDIESLRAALRRSFAILLQPGTGPQAGGRSFVRPLLDHPDLVLPPAAATLSTFVMLLTLWLAARIVRISGRLRRPWPALADMRFPPAALTALAAALIGTFLLDGMARVLALIVTSALLTVYGLLGLAVLHVLSRRIGGRGFLLAAVYFSIFALGWPMLLLSMLGLADTALDLRTRALNPPQPPSNI